MKCVPKLDGHYWVTIVMASVFGASTGDYLADGLGLGHMNGLPVLAALLAVILLADRFLKLSSALFYWAGIIVVRAAATNIGDIFHDFKIPFTTSIPIVLVVLLAVVLLWRFVRRDAFAAGVIPVNAFYWVTMFLAGTLGTVVGDWASYGLDLGNLAAALALAAPFVVMLAVGWKRLQSTLFYFWTLIVLVRASGTAAADFFAHNITLPLSTAATGVAFVAAVLVFYVFSRDHVAFKSQPGPLAPS